MDNRSFIVFTNETVAAYSYREMISGERIPDEIMGETLEISFASDADTGKISIIVGDNESTTVMRNGTRLSKGAFLLFHNDIIAIEKQKKRVLLLFSENGSKVKSVLLKIKEEKAITVGSGKECDIVIRNALVEEKHLRIKLSSEKTEFASLSKFGTYINGINAVKGALKKGDNIQIANCNIYFIGEAICATGEFELNGLQKYVISTEELCNTNENKKQYSEMGKTEFSPMPRIFRSIDKEVFKIDPPPAKAEQKTVPFILSVGPSLTMSLGMLVSVAVSIGNVVNNGINGSFITSSFMALSMLLGALLWPMLMRNYNKKQKEKYDEKCTEKYLSYLNDTEEEIRKTYENNKETISKYQLRSFEKLCSVFSGEKAEPFLWERDCDDEDFLTARLGTGFCKSGLGFSVEEKHFTVNENELEDKAREISERYSFYENVPIGISLRDNGITGMFGKDRYSEKVINNIIANISLLHSPQKVKTVFIFPNKSIAEKYSIYKDIPHIWNTERSMRYFACSKKEAESVLAEIYNKINVPEGMESKRSDEHYIIFAWDIEIVEKSALYELAKKEGSDKKLAFVFLSREYGKLPQECKATVQCSKELYGIYIKNQNDNRVIEFIPDDCDKILFDETINQLKKLKTSGEKQNKTVPQKITFLDMFKVGNVGMLDVAGRWQKKNSHEMLATPIGVTMNNEIVNFDIHEAAHGCHGIVAGTTGSGKSEFLQTYILSMMVNYSPEDVNFILVDFKGGDIATPFRNMPHLSAVVSNLSKNVLYRAMVSLEAEQVRRQKLFERKKLELNIDKIDINLYQKLYHAGVIKEALPHLIIIMDEFAQFKTQHSEYMQKLIDIAQIGRSLGIHLILATQKPAGIVDGQIWSNSRFKFCLKVLEREDSKAVLRRDEAAFINNPGAGYMQVGYNEIFKQFQSGYCRAKYIERTIYSSSEDITVQLIGSTGNVIAEQMDLGEKTVDSGKTQIDEIIAELENISKKFAYKQNPLWLPELAEKIYLEDYPERKNKDSFAIGVMDLPKAQKQCWLEHDFIKDGSIAVFGASGTGKTTFAQLILYQGICNLTPVQFRYGIIDIGGKSYSAFDNNEYCMGCVFEKENELGRFFDNLEKEIVNRKNILSENGCASFAELQQKKQNAIPMMIIVLENYAKFREEAYEYERRVIDAVSSGPALGIYFVVTSNSKSGIYSKVKEQLSKTVMFSLPEADAYRELFGTKTEIDLGEIKGRAFVKFEDEIVEMQTALSVKDEKATGYLDALEKKLRKSFSLAESRGESINQKSKAAVSNEDTVQAQKADLKAFPRNGFENQRKIFFYGKTEKDSDEICGRILGKDHKSESRKITGKPEENFDEILSELKKRLEKKERAVIIIPDFIQLYEDISDRNLIILNKFIRENPELVCVTFADDKKIYDYVDTELYINLCKKAEVLIFASENTDYKKAVLLNENVNKAEQSALRQSLNKDEYLVLCNGKCKKMNFGRDM